MSLFRDIAPVHNLEAVRPCGGVDAGVSKEICCCICRRYRALQGSCSMAACAEPSRSGSPRCMPCKKQGTGRSSCGRCLPATPRWPSIWHAHMPSSPSPSRKFKIGDHVQFCLHAHNTQAVTWGTWTAHVAKRRAKHARVNQALSLWAPHVQRRLFGRWAEQAKFAKGRQPLIAAILGRSMRKGMVRLGNLAEIPVSAGAAQHV